ncbi:MAG: hypothetical protein J6T71_02880 [Paludibacteraceae bacterium]|nr:hypothetical protein [Salinivirgaceae bacterium]MBO7456751.1 hypothetical protein [Paludibacteraceae bacterium]
MLTIKSKTFKSICLLLSCSIILASCYSTKYVSLQDDYNAKLNGKSYADIIVLLGPPDRTTPDGKNGEILIYEVKSQQGYSASNSIDLTESKKQTCIFVDENKICYNVTTDDKKEEMYYDKPKTIASLLLFGVLGLVIILTTAD